MNRDRFAKLRDLLSTVANIEEMPNVKKVVHTMRAPQAIGPYSQAVIAGGFVFTSGQVPFNPETGELVTGDIQAETRQVLINIAAVLEAAGTSMDNIVKTTVFLRDMNDFNRMNEIYATFFADAPPARSTVQAARLPRDVGVEIEAVAVIK